MSKKSTSKIVRKTYAQLNPSPPSTWAQVAIARDADIDFSDIAELQLPQRGTRQVTLRLDAEVVDWFRLTGRGYQTRMRLALRDYIRGRAQGKNGELIELLKLGKDGKGKPVGRFLLRRIA